MSKKTFVVKTEDVKMAKARLVLAKISPRKVQPVANFIRKKMAIDALDYLKFSNLKASAMIFKLLSSAVSNAKNKGMDSGSLLIEDVVVNEGLRRKGGRFVGRGNVQPLIKRTTHIEIKLVENSLTNKGEI